MLSDIMVDFNKYSIHKNSIRYQTILHISPQSLYEYAQLKLKHFYQNLSNSELKDEIDYYDEDLYDELVDNVTNETVLDTNNTGGKF